MDRMACSRDQLCLDFTNEQYSDDERVDSMLTNYDEREFDNVPIDHATAPSTSVMIMNSYFDFIYAKALYEIKGVTMKKSCYGCEINHPSQTQHDCLMNYAEYDDDDDAYRLDLYFEDMLKVVNEQDIIQSWDDIVRVSNISHEIIDLHKMVISSKDFLEVMKTEQWKNKMKKMILTISRLEKRLFQ